MTVSDALKKYKWFVAAGVIALVALIYFISHNSVVNSGNQKQQDLMADYKDTTNVLSNCLVQTKQSVGAINSQNAALDKIITDAVRGRYELGSSAKPGSGTLFSALSEQYPNTSELSKSYQQVLTIINGCRTDFKDSQSKLQASVANFNKWRTGSWTTRTFGGGSYPTHDLYVDFKGGKLYGKAALEQMSKLVVVSDAQSGRDNNSIDNNDPFGSS